MKASWEESFANLDKTVASAEAIGGYDLSGELSRYAGLQSSVLDFGCGMGNGVLRLRVAGYTDVVGVDPSDFLLAKADREARPHLHLLKNDVLPFPDAHFDLVYASGVLHHIPWEGIFGAMREISRVLKPGGIFLFAEPRSSALRSLAHMIILSPLSRFSKQASALASALRAEWPTYQPWLRRNGREFLPLCESLGFRSLSSERRLVTLIGALRKEAPARQGGESPLI